MYSCAGTMSDMKLMLLSVASGTTSQLPNWTSTLPLFTESGISTGIDGICNHSRINILTISHIQCRISSQFCLFASAISNWRRQCKRNHNQSPQHLPKHAMPVAHHEGSTTIRLRHFVYDTSSTDISSTDISSTTVYQRTGQLYIQLLFQQIIIFIDSNFYLHYDSFLSIPLPLTLW